jgi:mono/diheme cytochrome c family protein
MTRSITVPGLRAALLIGALACAAGSPLPALAATPAEVLAGYQAQAAGPASPERGQKLFTQRFKGGLFESCADCHTGNPLKTGRDQTAEKPLPPLAPAANPKRLTEATKVENYFRLNCKDVVGRECSAQEKADVLAWLIGLKP